MKIRLKKKNDSHRISLIRYPGSKSKLARPIIKRFPANMKLPMWSDADPWEYREPFFGAGAVGFEVMQHISEECKVWINDIDPGMAALWRTVKDNNREFMRLCSGFTPSVPAFDLFKKEDGILMDEAVMGFRKVALHRTSFSGYGAKSGSPLGGKSQSGLYKAGCRWNIQKIMLESHRAHRIMRKFGSFRVTCGDFGPMIETANKRTFIYLDPPYYEKGEQLYKYNMTVEDHVRLRDLLKDTPATWMLSYDDHPRIRELYEGFQIEPILVTYSNAVQKGGNRPKNQEVLIFKAA